jgi:threonine dehydratase
VIAGQGTIGLEIAESHPETTVVIVPIGGGGIISGISIAIKSLLPNAKGLRRSGCEHRSRKSFARCRRAR